MSGMAEAQSGSSCSLRAGHVTAHRSRWRTQRIGPGSTYGWWPIRTYQAKTDPSFWQAPRGEVLIAELSVAASVERAMAALRRHASSSTANEDGMIAATLLALEL